MYRSTATFNMQSLLFPRGAPVESLPISAGHKVTWLIKRAYTGSYLIVPCIHHVVICGYGGDFGWQYPTRIHTYPPADIRDFSLCKPVQCPCESKVGE